jgi:hypothetical protein
MTEDDFFTLSLHPAHIAGVHNYCDRWCERCPFADRCIVNAAQRHLLADEPPAQPDALLDHLKQRFESASAAIDRRWTGWNCPDEITDPPSRDPIQELEDERRRERVRAHPMVREATAYTSLVWAWFDTEAGTLKTHADDLATRAEHDDLDSLPSRSSMDLVLDSLAIVQHDAVLIASRLRRALQGREELATVHNWFDDPVQNDVNGSAKVALLSLDRAESSWRVIHKWCPASGAGHLLAEHAARVRTMAEREFPDARRFLRVGFDGPRSG